MKRTLIIKSFSLVLILVFLTYLSCYHFTDQHEFGITYNFVSGELKHDGYGGHHFSLPWVLAVKIDTRPVKVCIASASRNMNCRLVQFQTDEWRELIKFEGFRYYWFYNRFSFNSGQETYRGFKNLMLGHSYGQNKCTCVKVLQEIGEEN